MSPWVSVQYMLFFEMVMVPNVLKNVLKGGISPPTGVSKEAKMNLVKC